MTGCATLYTLGEHISATAGLPTFVASLLLLLPTLTDLFKSNKQTDLGENSSVHTFPPTTLLQLGAGFALSAPFLFNLPFESDIQVVKRVKWVEYLADYVPPVMDIFAVDPVPFGYLDPLTCPKDSESVEAAYDTLIFQHLFKELGIPNVTTRDIRPITHHAPFSTQSTTASLPSGVVLAPRASGSGSTNKRSSSSTKPKQPNGTPPRRNPRRGQQKGGSNGGSGSGSGGSGNGSGNGSNDRTGGQSGNTNPALSPPVKREIVPNAPVGSEPPPPPPPPGDARVEDHNDRSRDPPDPVEAFWGFVTIFIFFLIARRFSPSWSWKRPGHLTIDLDNTTNSELLNALRPKDPLAFLSKQKVNLNVDFVVPRSEVIYRAPMIEQPSLPDLSFLAAEPSESVAEKVKISARYIKTEIGYIYIPSEDFWNELPVFPKPKEFISSAPWAGYFQPIPLRRTLRTYWLLRSVLLPLGLFLWLCILVFYLFMRRRRIRRTRFALGDPPDDGFDGDLSLKADTPVKRSSIPAPAVIVGCTPSSGDTSTSGEPSGSVPSDAIEIGASSRENSPVLVQHSPSASSSSAPPGTDASSQPHPTSFQPTQNASYHASSSFVSGSSYAPSSSGPGSSSEKPRSSKPRPTSLTIDVSLTRPRPPVGGGADSPAMPRSESSGPSVDKGKGKAVDKGKGRAVDKIKGKAVGKWKEEDYQELFHYSDPESYSSPSYGSDWSPSFRRPRLQLPPFQLPDGYLSRSRTSAVDPPGTPPSHIPPPLESLNYEESSIVPKDFPINKPYVSPTHGTFVFDRQGGHNPRGTVDPVFRWRKIRSPPLEEGKNLPKTEEEAEEDRPEIEEETVVDHPETEEETLVEHLETVEDRPETVYVESGGAVGPISEGFLPEDLDARLTPSPGFSQPIDGDNVGV